MPTSGAVGGRAVWTFDGQRWIGPQSLGADISDLSCSSPTHCLAVSPGGGFQFDGRVWSPVPPVAVDGASARYVACATSTFCLTTTDNGSSSIFNGAMWSTPASMGTTADEFALSCATPTFCMAVGRGSSSVYNGLKWSATALPIGFSGFGISCPTATMCVTVGAPSNSSGDAGATGALYRDGRWTPVTMSTSGYGLGRVMCATSSFCVAVGGQDGNGQTVSGAGTVAVFDGTTWTKPVTVEHRTGLGAIACPDLGSCVALDDDGRVYTGTVPTSPQPVRPTPTLSPPPITLSWDPTGAFTQAAYQFPYVRTADGPEFSAVPYDNSTTVSIGLTLADAATRTPLPAASFKFSDSKVCQFLPRGVPYDAVALPHQQGTVSFGCVPPGTYEVASVDVTKASDAGAWSYTQMQLATSNYWQGACVQMAPGASPGPWDLPAC